MNQPITLRIIITHKQGRLLNRPIIRIQQETSNPNIMKEIISSAFHNKPLTVQPTFIDKNRAINTLIKNGIIYKDNETYHYNI